MHRLIPICLAALLLTGCARNHDLPELQGAWMSTTLPATPYRHLVFRVEEDADDLTIVVLDVS